MKAKSKKELLNRLAQVREACAVATSPEDTNVNVIIEEISTLAAACIEKLAKDIAG